MAEKLKFGDRLFLVGEKVFFDNGENDAYIESRNGTLVILGNLTVEGTTTTVNTEETLIADPFMTLNSDHTGPATQDVGFEVNRGDDPTVRFAWDELNDRWSFEDQDIFTTGNISATTYSGNLVGNVVSETGVIIIDHTGDGTVDIRNGNIDNTVIGATTPAAAYFTELRANDTYVDGDLDVTGVFTTITTDGLTEGVNNLYYTDERVDDRVAALFEEGYGITSNYDDTAGQYLIEFDAQNIGTGEEVLDTSDTTKASFRTIVTGNIANGGNNDLTVEVSGDEIVIDTASKLNVLAYNTYTGNGTINQYTLPYSVNQDWQVLVHIDGVAQEPSVAYTIQNGNTVTLASNLPNLSVMTVHRLATTHSVSGVVDADTLNGQNGTYYLNYNNFHNTPTNVSEFVNDAGYITEADDNQTLSFSSPDLSISNGNSVDISGLTTGLATETYVDNAIANIPAPSGGGYPNFVSSENLSHSSAVGGTTVTATIPSGATIAYIPWTTTNSASSSGPFNVIVNGTSYFVDDMATGGDAGSTSGLLEIGLSTGTIIMGGAVTAMLGTSVTSLQLYSQHNDSGSGFASVSATVYYDA